MSRHPVDHQSPSDGTRTEQFLDIERQSGEEGSHPAAKALHRRPADRSKTDPRVEEYTRIEKGREA